MQLGEVSDVKSQSGFSARVMLANKHVCQDWSSHISFFGWVVPLAAVLLSLSAPEVIIIPLLFGLPLMASCHLTTNWELGLDKMPNQSDFFQVYSFHSGV